jgi:thioredoxin-related protein
MRRWFGSWPVPAVAVLALLSGHAAVAPAAPVEVPATRDLREDARLAQRAGLPIVLVVSQHACGYCELLDREVLHPLIISGEYTEKVILRKIDVVSGTPVVDFDGKPVLPRKLARRYSAFVTPTVLFLDHQGREVAPKIVGVNTIEFYWGYLDEAIDQALARVRDCDGSASAQVARAETPPGTISC